jgi:hypothetical protein
MISMWCMKPLKPSMSVVVERAAVGRGHKLFGEARARSSGVAPWVPIPRQAGGTGRFASEKTTRASQGANTSCEQKIEA